MWHGLYNFQLKAHSIHSQVRLTLCLPITKPETFSETICAKMSSFSFTAIITSTNCSRSSLLCSQATALHCSSQAICNITQSEFPTFLKNQTYPFEYNQPTHSYLTCSPDCLVIYITTHTFAFHALWVLMTHKTIPMYITTNHRILPTLL